VREESLCELGASFPVCSVDPSVKRLAMIE